MAPFHRRVLVAVGLSACLGGCAEEPRSVVEGARAEAVGRYVRYYTTDQKAEGLCAGTVDYVDNFVESVFIRLGETPPAHPFIDYYWLTPDEVPCLRGSACAAPGGIIYASESLDLHEITHAIHDWALPRSASILHEGLAVRFEGVDYEVGYTDPWTGPLEADAITEHLTSYGHALDDNDYRFARDFVGHTIERHGMEGFKDFWRKVPPQASADHVRWAYFDTFGETVEAMLASTWGVNTCSMTLCDGAVIPWRQEQWRTHGAPDVCDAPASLGPRLRGAELRFAEFRSIMQVLEAGSYQATLIGGAEDELDELANQRAEIWPCEVCRPVQYVETEDLRNGPSRLELEEGRYMVVTHGAMFRIEPPVEVTIRSSLAEP